MLRLQPRSCYKKLGHCVIRYLSSTSEATPHVCIVGSGPAGFYTAQQLLKGHPKVRVDILEKLPVPFGLVRFGVAPDHPEVKNVINTFTQTAQNDRCRFIGNVHVGDDVTVAQLRHLYTAVVFCYGADDDRTLGIPGEDIHGVYSARSFVGWYNGLPENTQLEPDLDTDTAVLVGHGNVALDIARILLTPVDILKKTDITQHALEALSRSRVRRVYTVGRRGPLQVAFTIKELREMTKIPDCTPVINKEDITPLESIIKDIPRPRKRLSELMIKTAKAEMTDSSKEWHLKFLRSPLEIIADNTNSRVGAIRLGINKLEGPLDEKQKSIPTEEEESLPCGLVLRSIGYKSISIDGAIPFDTKQGIIKNTAGRVHGENGLYCSGWVRRGPTGVILTTMTDGFDVGKVIVEDLNSGAIQADHTHVGYDGLMVTLNKSGVKTVSFSEWEKIDNAESRNGEKVGKPREKFTNIKSMMDLVT
ncbi:unnamed protein product [Owenia fusiformis]|uniref:NADPH:adrenodoxin oxidoreductase, mitochondrial n=1 Tax=Owenia fusiformis TaxID=6347 RepID=A0A8J1UP38_OWEFU|nr:unnamed protein product [Owenia fusiformis]